MANWGQYGYLNKEEEQILDEFLRRAPEIHVEDSRYSAEVKEQLACRFLRARNFDVNKALDLLREASDTLRDHNASDWAAAGPAVAALCDEKVIKTFYPHSQQGFDRFGRLLLFEHNGKANITAIRHVTTPARMVSYHLWTMEKVLDDYFLRAPRNPAGRHVVSTLAICDFEGLGFGHLSSAMFDHLKLLIKLDNVCYPEMLGKMVIINAPSLAVGFFNMIKGWLDPRTQRKIEFHGSGPEMLKRLSELISKDNLPKMYGGLAPDPYFHKPHTEHVSVPRDGELKRTIKIKRGMTLEVDTYVCDGPISISISATNNSSPNPIVLEPGELFTPSVHGEPERFLKKIPYSELNPEEENLFTVVWKNANWASGCMIVYSLTPAQPESGVSGKLDAPHPNVHDIPAYKIITVQGTLIEPGPPLAKGIFGFFGV